LSLPANLSINKILASLQVRVSFAAINANPKKEHKAYGLLEILD